MCGLAGIHDLNGHGFDALRPSFEAMSASIVHRGPDEHGAYEDDRVVLLHRRLAIVDLVTGQQPMSDASGDLVLVYNGEIFNYVELREMLTGDGAEFQTTSDTEVILHLYRKFGLDFVDHLNGQFAIALRDVRRDRLVLVRDRVGICPLYYAKTPSHLVFASEIKALLPALRSSPSISLTSLDDVFTFWVPASPATIFEGILEVRPGHMLVVDGNRINEHCYWDWDFPAPGAFCQDSLDTVAEELRSLLGDATRIRLRSDVPVGGYLSGGLDSTILLAMIGHAGIHMNSFSINFEDAEFDEGAHQDEVVRHLGTEHRRILCRSDEIGEKLLDTVWHGECPVLRSAPVPMGMLSGLAHEAGYKVVLTGEGADEVFCGYDIFRENKVRQFWAKAPDSNMRAALLKRLYPYLDLPAGGSATYLKSFFGQGLDEPDTPWFSHLPRWNTTAKGKAFFSEATKAAVSDSAIERLMTRLPRDLSRDHPLNRAQYLEAKTLMAGYLLTSQGDRMLMKHSVEGRFPYLDHRVIEFANRLPPKYKLRGLNEKYVLKEAFEDFIPGSIRNRYKQPYRAPDVNDASSLLNAQTRELLSEDSLRRSGLFDPKKVGFFMRKIDSGRRITISEAQSLMGIMTTQAIQHMFVESHYRIG